MPHWKLTIEYDGTDFAGWQTQPDVRTVQAELDRALSIVTRETIRVQGAGRTDAGVHALGQVASVATDTDLDALRYAANSVLDDDVVIRSAVPAPDGFHARFDAVRRHYRYRLHRGPTALERRTSLAVRSFPEVEPMRVAARKLLGHHDFTSFATLGEPDEITECIVEKLDVVERGSFLDVEVSANRFLRRMVRTLVGTLLEIGQGKRPPEWIEEVLVARDRRAAGPVIAARGLCLVAVDYPTEPEEGGRR